MTVHRAKGLEFDVVVLPELERRLGDLNNPLVLVHRPAPTSPIAAVHRGTNKTVRACSEPLREVHWQEVARRVADDLGVLYVALTRARSELHLIVQPTPRSSAGRATFAELLRHALASAARERWGAGGAVLYEEGGVVDLAALRRARGAAGAPPAPRPEEGHLEPRVEQESRPPRRPRVPRLALERPSQLAGAVNEGTRAVRELLRLEPAEERLRGALMHEWLRHVEWLDEGGGLPAADHAWRLAQGIAPGLDRERVARWRDALARALEAPAVAAAFSRPPGKAGSYRLWRERPFALALDGRLVRGVVDRALVWGAREAPSGVELFEIKSDRVASGGVDLVVERHRLQVLAYRQAVATMLGLLPTAVRGSLVLLDAAAVIAVE
jgi:ATP-dependent exoDNAse (exonuclease V) beta subunit